MRNFLKIIILLIFILILGGFFFFIQRPKEKEALPELDVPKIMKIFSPAFEPNSPISSKYTCDGENVNPPLEIKDIPENAESLVLIVDDPDAPMGTFLHWVVFNINPKVSFIEENSVPEGGIQGRNDFGRDSYGGPCPPSGTHRYFFKIFALDKKLELAEGVSLGEVERAIEGHILDKAELVGLYQRK